MSPSTKASARYARRAAFSLTEVAIALGIAAIALTALLGLLPSGMNNFRAALDAQTAGEIFQRVVADAQETDFDTLMRGSVENGGPGGQFYRLALRHFDEQGNEVKTANPDSPTAAEAAKILYTVRVRGALPGDADPQNHKDTTLNSLPGATAPRFNSRDLTFLTVQVASTSGTRKVTPLVDAGTFLISPALATKAGMNMRTYTAIVARNGYQR